jgi:hypothetical protein
LLLASGAADAFNVMKIGRALIISGEIEVGDLKEFDGIDLTRINSVTLSGPGGNLAEGLKIAKQLHSGNRIIDIRIPRACISACAALLAANGNTTLRVDAGGFLAFHGGTIGYFIAIADYLSSKPELLANGGEMVSPQLARQWVENTKNQLAELKTHYESVRLDAAAMLNLLRLGNGKVAALELRELESSNGEGNRIRATIVPEASHCSWFVPDEAGLRSLGFKVNSFTLDRAAIAKRLKVSEDNICWQLTSVPTSGKSDAQFNQ